VHTTRSKIGDVQTTVGANQSVNQSVNQSISLFRTIKYGKHRTNLKRRQHENIKLTNVGKT